MLGARFQPALCSAYLSRRRVDPYPACKFKCVLSTTYGTKWLGCCGREQKHRNVLATIVLAKNFRAVTHLHGYVRWVHNKLPRNHILSGKTGLGCRARSDRSGGWCSRAVELQKLLLHREQKRVIFAMINAPKRDISRMRESLFGK